MLVSIFNTSLMAMVAYVEEGREKSILRARYLPSGGREGGRTEKECERKGMHREKERQSERQT